MARFDIAQVLTLFVLTSCTPTITGFDEDIEAPLDCVGTVSNRLLYHSHQSLVGNPTEPSLATNVWSHDFERGEAVPLTQSTEPGVISGAATFGMDRTKIFFESNQDLTGDPSAPPLPSRNIWMADVDGQNAQPLTFNQLSELDSRQASSFGNFLVFHSYMNLSGVPNAPGTRGRNVWVYDLALETYWPITYDTIEGHGSAGPSIYEDKIVYRSRTALDGSPDATPVSQNIWISNLDGSDRTPLTQNTSMQYASQSPAISSNGKITFTSKMDLGGGVDGIPTLSYNVWVMDLDGSNKMPLTFNTLEGYDAQAPSFSPDGNYVLFTSSQDLFGTPDGTPTLSRNVWIASVDGSGAFPVTQNTLAGLDSHGPGFSADGTFVFTSAFLSITGQDDGAPTLSRNIWQLDLGTGERTTLTNELVSDAHSYLSGNKTSLSYGLAEGGCGGSQ